MDNVDNTSSKSPHLCTEGCGFFGSPAFNNMCSRCFKAKHKDATDDTVVVSAIEKSRKHLRSPSPSHLRIASAPTSAIPSPDIQPNTLNEKSIQTNKGRCFKCRSKVPLAKQATNKCRCSYVFCDSHRYPDRHECTVDFAKMDRELLAKNNPKLHERPKGGRSFHRIDSL